MKPLIFVSHINEEADVAKWLSDSISQLLLGGVQFFVSSDGTAIVGGDPWLSKIEQGLRDASIVLVLCSSCSVQRPWVNFEAGGAWIAGKRVVPICHAGMHPAGLPEPLRTLQAYDLLKRKDIEALVGLLASEAGLKTPKFDSGELLANIPDSSTMAEPENKMTAALDYAPIGEDAGPVGDVVIGYDKQSITSELHTYSLNVSVMWWGPRDQDFFNICLLWPRAIKIAKLVGFEKGEEMEIDGILYDELSLFVDKRLWPKKTIRAIGGKAAAQIEYVFDSPTHMQVHSHLKPKSYRLFYKLYSQEFPPVEGEVSFKDLNIY
ncbi:MAG: toll/interleukin-1 receptor domain-containing protein [Desulfobacteraceae bacterium]|nr:toll/interleukin-1 receptor domain-containing protein [Desulfobacteraceae bacterium]